MQLTANFLVLASAIILSIPSILSLPINEGSGSYLAARDVDYLDIDAREMVDFDVDAREMIDFDVDAREIFDYDLDARELADFEMDAREVDDFQLEVVARELIDAYHEAREYHDQLDARDTLDLEGREFYDYIVTRAAADNAAFITAHGVKKTQIKAIFSIPKPTIEKIEREVPDFKAILAKLAPENDFLQKETTFTPPSRTPAEATTTLANKQKRAADLKTIAEVGARWDSATAADKVRFKQAVAGEKTYREAYEKKQAAKPTTQAKLRRRCV